MQNTYFVLVQENYYVSEFFQKSTIIRRQHIIEVKRDGKKSLEDIFDMYLCIVQMVHMIWIWLWHINWYMCTFMFTKVLFSIIPSFYKKDV